MVVVMVMYQIRAVQITPSKYRRKIKKKGLNIWTNDETGMKLTPISTNQQLLLNFN